MGTAHIVAIVTLQAFVVVAGPPLMAILVELRRTHLTAATAIGDKADPWGTEPGPCRTLTDHGTARQHLKEQTQFVKVFTVACPG